MADPFRLLRDDHGRVRSLTAAFAAVGDDAGRRDLAARIGETLRVHTAVAGEVLYPALVDGAGTGLREIVARSERDHAVQAALLTRALVEFGAPPDPDAPRPAPPAAAGDTPVADVVAQLAQAVTQHAQDEETHLFPAAQRDLGDALERIGERLVRRRQALQQVAAPTRPAD
jgi:hypothetical protein